MTFVSIMCKSEVEISANLDKMVLGLCLPVKVGQIPTDVDRTQVTFFIRSCPACGEPVMPHVPRRVLVADWAAEN